MIDFGDGIVGEELIWSADFLDHFGCNVILLLFIDKNFLECSKKRVESLETKVMLVFIALLIEKRWWPMGLLDEKRQLSQMQSLGLESLCS